MTLTCLESCIDKIQQWMLSHYLAINESKTQFFVAGISQQLNKLDDININVGNSSIQLSLKIRNLGIRFDSKITFRDHIDCIYRKIMFQLIKTKHHFSWDSLNVLINAFVVSNPDYCNSLLYDTSNCVLDKLQKILQ